jgi:hypothetical protein
MDNQVSMVLASLVRSISTKHIGARLSICS